MELYNMVTMSMSFNMHPHYIYHQICHKIYVSLMLTRLITNIM